MINLILSSSCLCSTFIFFSIVPFCLNNVFALVACCLVCDAKRERETGSCASIRSRQQNEFKQRDNLPSDRRALGRRRLARRRHRRDSGAAVLRAVRLGRRVRPRGHSILRRHSRRRAMQHVSGHRPTLGRRLEHRARRLADLCGKSVV